MARYRIVLRRPMGPTQPHRDRKLGELTTDQPTLADALAWAYRQLLNTRDRAIVDQLSAITVAIDPETRKLPAAPSAGAAQ